MNLNIRSLPSKFEQVELLLDEENIKILNLSESWLDKDVTNSMLRIEQYKIHRLDRQKRKKGGGLCTYVHKTLKVDALKYENINTSTWYSRNTSP